MQEKREIKEEGKEERERRGNHSLSLMSFSLTDCRFGSRDLDDSRRRKGFLPSATNSKIILRRLTCLLSHSLRALLIVFSHSVIEILSFLVSCQFPSFPIQLLSCLYFPIQSRSYLLSFLFHSFSLTFLVYFSYSMIEQIRKNHSHSQ